MSLHQMRLKANRERLASIAEVFDRVAFGTCCTPRFSENNDNEVKAI